MSARATGREKGTRFRPLSLKMPKPLFPVAGLLRYSVRVVPN
jgi:hypothetical protein